MPAPFRVGRRQRSNTQGAGTDLPAGSSLDQQQAVRPRVHRRVAFWQRPWYKRGTD
jgi:hypothetical protein